MARFIGTFGVQYKTEKHPSGYQVDPDGYILIHADSFNEAVDLMREKFGSAYAFVYPEEVFAEPSGSGKTGYEFHPNGVQDVLIGKPPAAEPAGGISQPGFVKVRPENNDHYVAQFESWQSWWPIIKETHEKLTDLVPGYNLAQIKEKFGGLRFYIDQGNVSEYDWDKHHAAAQEIVDAAESAVDDLGDKK